MNKRVVIVGAGFAGLNCAKLLGNRRGVEVVLLDRRNHHLFQPLLYQVATAGLSPADIAVPIRSLLSRYRNIWVAQAQVTNIELRQPVAHGNGSDGNGSRGNGSGGDGADGGESSVPGRGNGRGSAKPSYRPRLGAAPCDQLRMHDIENAAGVVYTDHQAYPFHYLVLAAGAQHAYFGHEDWEVNAPGLKTLEQATEIRRRLLDAFETAEVMEDPDERRAALTFVVIGGGPTGVELAGAIGEVSRYTLSKDFHCIDPKLTRIILVEAGPRILPSFPEELSAKATKYLEQIGVQVWTRSPVTNVDDHGVNVGEERIRARTVLWAAGVRASETGSYLGVPRDRAGRVMVGKDLTVPRHPNVFVLGDQAHALGQDGKPLPGVATVALQQGRYVARTILDDLAGRPRRDFVYWDKGQMATVGRRRAVLETGSGSIRLGGLLAWIAWLIVHVYYLTGFKKRLLVLLQWSWSYVTFSRGARLIVGKEWRSYGDVEEHRRSLPSHSEPEHAHGSQ